MDAAHKLPKTFAILFAFALLMATPTWAQPTLQVASTATIYNNGTAFVQVASSAHPTTEITYTVTNIDYSVDTSGSTSHNWLTPPSGGTTPSYLTFNITNTSGVIRGASVRVTLHATAPASGVPDVSILVIYDGGIAGGGGGGGGGVLTATPNPVSLYAGSNSSASTPVNITTTGLDPVTISLSSSVYWLTAATTNNSLSAAAGTSITVSGDATAMVSGTYQGIVTVTPSAGTAINITVNFIVGSGSGAGWITTPSTMSWSYVSGSAVFPMQSVVLTAPSGSSTYTVRTLSTNGWLLVNGGSGDGISATINVGNGFTLKAGANISALASGPYSGQAIIQDESGVEQLRVTVNLTVNGASSPGLSINPNPVSFTAALNGAQQSSLVYVTSSTGGTLSVNGTLPAGMSFALPANIVIPAGGTLGFTVYANPAGLTANTYTGTLAVAVGTQTGTVVVNFVVGNGGTSGGTGTTAVAPTNLSFTYQLGSSTTSGLARQKLVITGPAGSWSSVMSDSTSWLHLSPAGGISLPDPTMDGAAPVVSVDPSGLAVGTYTGTISITTPGGTQNVQVTLVVTPGTALVASPGSLIFNAQSGQAAPPSQSVYVSASDGGVNPVSITATTSSSWINISYGATYVTVQVNQSGLSSGTYSGWVTIAQSGAATSNVPVVLVVNGGGGGGTYGSLTFSASSLNFTSTNGSTPAAVTLSVSATSATSFVGSISYTNGSGWLTVTPLADVTPKNLNVAVNPAGLAAGTYNATISFNANGVVQTVNVTLAVTTSGATGNVSAAPTSLSFTAVQGASPGAKSLAISSASGSAGIPFTVQITSGSGWLFTSANSSNTTPVTFTVSVNSNSLAVGSYTGNIQLQPTGGATLNIPVSLSVTEPPTVSAAPTALSFDYLIGTSATSTKTLTVSAGTGSLGFSATPSSTGNWLTVSPGSGTTPATLNVSFNPGGFTTGVGTYTGTILVAGTGGAPGTTTVTVTANVTAAFPTITRVTNAASYAISNSIAPGEIITLFGNDAVHPIGPATPVGMALLPSGKAIATTLGGVQVLVNNTPCPLVYVSASQVSAIVPYEVKQLASANIQVKYLNQTSNGVPVTVTTTAPGVFTANSSGTGPGAILNGDLSLNTSGNAAARGSTIVVYLTGEGETSPFGVTGLVTTVAAPPLPLTPGPLLTPSILIGGAPANWSFAGEAPGFVSGVLQLNVQVPSNIAPGDQPIVVYIGGNPSQSGVTVSVK